MSQNDKYIKSEQDLRLDSSGLHIPNCVGILESDSNTGTGCGYIFAPEDMKKMFNMSRDEMIEYRDKLIAEQKYIRKV